MQKNTKNDTSKRIAQLNKQSRAHLNNYTENLERLNKSPHTIKSYQNDLLQFLEWLQHTKHIQLYQVEPRNNWEIFKLFRPRWRVCL